MSKHPKDTALSFDEFDERRRPAMVTTGFDDVLDRAQSRRGFMKSAAMFGTAAFVMSVWNAAASKAAGRPNFDFEPVATNTLDTVTVPRGYSWRPLIKWGDPLWSDGAPFDDQSRGTGRSQARAFGDNNDGMAIFSKEGRHIIAINNEFANRGIIYGNRASSLPETTDDILKGKMAHGISIFEIADHNGAWAPVIDSEYNRRITADTSFEITGPARSHEWLKTTADPTGTRALGTFNNCGNGETPWGTYLACEENFNGYFSSSDPSDEPSDAFKRYGIGNKDWGYGWAKTDARFDISKYPNEPNRFGYVVEIDPLDPTSTPKKRTALGRFKHENAELVLSADRHVVVYMGDDERGEFLYKFVSASRYDAKDAPSDLLDDGTLYVAIFNDDMTGRWVALTPETTGMASNAEICIHTRIAASVVNATTMDRPEWVAAHPGKAEVYVALTNNKNRGKKSNRGGDATPLNGPNPRAKNKYGQILRWRPDGHDHGAMTFSWDLFVLAGNPTQHNDEYAGSSNINADNMFNSPDGLGFDSQGRLWIQTDGKVSNKGDFAGQGNNQMLMGDPGTGEIRRFMVGPKECEITGLCWSPDKRTMFVGIQHPGEKGGSHFPSGGTSVPRSCVIAVTRDDGGVVG